MNEDIKNYKFSRDTFKNELGNEIEIGIIKDLERLSYEIKGPNSSTSNELTLMEAKILADSLLKIL